MRCPNCGQKLREGDKFCANCGAPAPLDTSPDPYDDPNQYSSPSPPPINLPAFRVAPVASRSFTTQAVITLVLYWVFWMPGLIANLLFWNEANQVERETGQAPEGKGCLVALFIVWGILPILSICLLSVIAVSSN